MVLNLKNSAGKVLSHNVYWMAKDNNYRSLNGMLETSVNTSIIKQEKGKSESKWTLQVTNNSGTGWRFFIRPRLMVNDEGNIA